MLVTLKEILADARKKKYAVGAFNVTNVLCLSPILKAAEKKGSPVIVNVAEVSYNTIDMDRFHSAIVHSAREARVPVTVNLDHGVSDQAVMAALRYGFSSVMYDASALPLDENIAKTRMFADLAHSVGVSVEGELGAIGGGEGEGGQSSSDPSMFTPVDKVIPFLEGTGVDALAVSIGNAHGFYKGEPKLEFDLLGQIAERADIPLVLHGGSGISDADFRKAASMGICKINFYTGLSAAAFDSLKSFMRETGDGYADLTSVSQTIMDAIQKKVEDRMDVFGSSGRA